MDDYSSSLMIKELHGDLARKYKTHGAKVEAAWRSFNRLQRAKCMKDGMAEGAVLKHSSDTSLGNVYKFIPEWNLADLTDPKSDRLLDILKHRATTSLSEQYSEGVNGSPGDFELIDEMTKKKNLRHVNPFTNCYTFFYDEKYGESIQVSSEHIDEVLASLRVAIDRGILVPQSLGELILQRQITLLQCLNVIIEDILEQGSHTRKKGQSNKQSRNAATAPLSKAAKNPAVKPTPQEVVASARDQKSSLEEYLSLLRSEPTVLCPGVNHQFFSRSELVPDEKGRSLPVHTDKYIGPAVFEAIHQAVQGVAIWDSITGLVDLLQKPSTDKLYKSMVLQELSNLCQLEYTRTQTLFKRQISTGMGSKWFKRLSNVYDNLGNAKLSMKGKPEELTRSDPQLHYLLRLCQPDVTAAKAVEWMEKLGDLHRSHPEDREKLYEREDRTLYDMAAIVAFAQDFSSVYSLPSPSKKKGHSFVSALQELEIELNLLKKQVDLRDYAAPIDNLLEPGMSAKALEALDGFVIDKTGTKMGFLYQDDLEKTFKTLEEQYQQAKDKLAKNSKSVILPIDTTPPDPVERIESRRKKEKTRPSHSSIYAITPTTEPLPEKDSAPPAQPIKVSSTTAEVFATLFDKNQSRGSVSWASFEAAMAELGFSVIPRFGSVYTFRPSESIAAQRPVSIHRPHQSQIEGYLTLILARRLNRAYGWSETSFESN
ncbi:Ff.00g128980.m01.CDS01 [Fusarium sp. VM40]|nr:Ff.00g128980.m01.CDS01 [Fusarium sp. VM40]